MVPFSGEICEVIDEPLYDTRLYSVTRPQSSAQLAFFGVPIGSDDKGSGRHVTEEDTNMYLANQLPKPQQFLVEGFAVECPRRLAEEGVLEFMIGSKTYHRSGPLSLYVRERLTVIFNAAPERGYAEQLMSRLKNWHNNYVPYGVALPYAIHAEQNFGVWLRWANAPVVPEPVRVRVELCGKLLRPVA